MRIKLSNKILLHLFIALLLLLGALVFVFRPTTFYELQATYTQVIIYGTLFAIAIWMLYTFMVALDAVFDYFFGTREKISENKEEEIK